MFYTSFCLIQIIFYFRPTPSVSWCFYNPFNYQCRPIVSDSKYLLQFGNRRLLIKDIGYSDAGIYRCIMKLDAQEIKRDINLTIHSKNDVVQIDP